MHTQLKTVIHGYSYTHAGGTVALRTYLNLYGRQKSEIIRDRREKAVKISPPKFELSHDGFVKFDVRMRRAPVGS